MCTAGEVKAYKAQIDERDTIIGEREVSLTDPVTIIIAIIAGSMAPDIAVTLMGIDRDLRPKEGQSGAGEVQIRVGSSDQGTQATD